MPRRWRPCGRRRSCGRRWASGGRWCLPWWELARRRRLAMRHRPQRRGALRGFGRPLRGFGRLLRLLLPRELQRLLEDLLLLLPGGRVETRLHAGAASAASRRATSPNEGLCLPGDRGRWPEVHRWYLARKQTGTQPHQTQTTHNTRCACLQKWDLNRSCRTYVHE